MRCPRNIRPWPVTRLPIGRYLSPSPYDHQSGPPPVTPWVQRLIFANIGVFFLQMVAPDLLNPFVFVPMLVLSRPWSIVTYMFLHGGVMHILFNMIALFFFGPRV